MPNFIGRQLLGFLLAGILGPASGAWRGSGGLAKPCRLRKHRRHRRTRIMERGNRLMGKVAIVTVVASGIGAETARQFGQHGATVVVCDLQDEVGRGVAGEIVAAGGMAEYRALDVCNEGQWVAIVAEVEEKYRR